MNRKMYFDYLRVLATFIVMFLHVASHKWGGVDANTYEWQVMNAYDGIARWGVPVFIMISGALFLGKDYSLERIWRKNIFRLIIAYLFWGFLYAYGDYGKYGILKVLQKSMEGHYHMWFIPMIIGLYICIPILNKIVETEWVMKYFLGVALGITFLIPQMINIINDLGSATLIKIVRPFGEILSNMNLSLVAGYTFYFILGHYLSNVMVEKKTRRIIYLLGIFGFVSTIGLNAIVSIKFQQPCGTYYGDFTVNVMLEALSVFICLKYNAGKLAKIDKYVVKLSKYSFGAYLVHAMIIENFDYRLGVTALSFNPVISIPIITMLVFAISFAVSALLNHIPVLKKYVV